MTANIKGNNVSNATPSAGQTLTWDGTQWAPGSPGGGITQLTSDVTAGPGSGSQGATVRGVTGNPGGVLGYNRIPVVDYAYFQCPTNGYVPISWDIQSAQEVRVGSLESGGYGQIPYVRISPQTEASLGVIGAAPSVRAAKLGVYGALAVLAGGFQQATHVRLTGGSYTTDSPYHFPQTTVDFYLECAFAVGSGGQTIVLPAQPWPDSVPNSPGRVFVVTDVLGTCSVADPIVLTDPTGRTFNGAAGPYTITLPSNVCTITLDSSLTNWILGFQSGSPI